MMKRLGLLALVIFSVPLAAGTIRIAGSDTMADMNKRLGKTFSKAHPETKIDVNVGDTTFGIKQLVDGKADIAAAARPMKGDEVAKLSSLNTFVVGKDAVVIYVHQSNRMKAMPLTQIGDILAGKITNWKQVGGADMPITVIGREEGAASQKLLIEQVTKGRPIATSKHEKSVQDALKLVAADPTAIGFGGGGNYPGVKPISLVLDGSPMPVLPNQESISRGVYPLARILYYYMNGKPTAEVQRYLDFVHSPEGQKILVESGFFRN